MRKLVTNALRRLTRWFERRALPARYQRGPWTVIGDSSLRPRQPTALELLAELKGTAWTCASINAGVCASFPPRLYVSTRPDQSPPRCVTRWLDQSIERKLRTRLPARASADVRIEEVVEHPLLALLEQVNPLINAFDLWELTTLYQEVHGVAYWQLGVNTLCVPR